MDFSSESSTCLVQNKTFLKPFTFSSLFFLFDKILQGMPRYLFLVSGMWNVETVVCRHESFILGK